MTGEFIQEMKMYFNADEGAFTTFTDMEIQKGTFNVKAVIRDLLIKNIGQENIPRSGMGQNQNIEFNICPKSKIYGTETIEIPCKFSKPDKKEMTIYFNREQMSPFQEGDYWYIYFKKGTNNPFIGIISEQKWVDLFESLSDELLSEPDETDKTKLEYAIPAIDISFKEIEAPDIPPIITGDRISQTRKSMSADEAAVKAHNKKAKGDMGEQIAVEIEKRRLSSIHREDLIPKITHVAKFKDGLGYDIISVDIDSSGNEQEIYIEVKTTAGGKEMPFYVSSNELGVSQKLRELYYIYRICNMRTDCKSVDYYRLQGAISDTCDLTPVDYIAKPHLNEK